MNRTSLPDQCYNRLVRDFGPQFGQTLHSNKAGDACIVIGATHINQRVEARAFVIRLTKRVAIPQEYENTDRFRGPHYGIRARYVAAEVSYAAVIWSAWNDQLETKWCGSVQEARREVDEIARRWRAEYDARLYGRQ